MAYDIEGLKRNRPGETAEVSDNGSPKAGLYRHPETGAEAITTSDRIFGEAQSEAFVRLGFVRVGDAPEGSIKDIIINAEPERVYNSNTVESDRARLDALELAELRREKAERLTAEEAARKKQIEEAEKAQSKTKK